MKIRIQFDASFYEVGPDYFEKILGAIIGRACLFHYKTELQTISAKAYQEWLSNFPGMADTELENILDLSALYAAENACGYRLETPYTVLEESRRAVRLLASKLYGPVLRELLDRVTRGGSELGGYFLRKYGNFYRQSLEAEPHAPLWVFCQSSLAAGLPVEKWLSGNFNAISEELGLEFAVSDAA